MFRSLFDPNSAFSRGMERVWTLVVLNVLWVLCSLPVVTIGPSTAALYQVLGKVIQGEDSHTARKFFAAWRENFKCALLVWLPMLAVLPRDHPMANAECYPLENCKYDRFIMPALGCDDDIEALFTQNGIEPNVQFTTLESFSVMSMVEQGLGMSIMNQLITEKRICDIAMLPLDPPSYCTLGVAMNSKADVSPAVKMFLKYAVRMLTRIEKA